MDSNPMSLREMLDRKNRMAQEISALVRDFEHETKCYVAELTISRQITITAPTLPDRTEYGVFIGILIS